MTALGVYYWESARSDLQRDKALRFYKMAARRGESHALHNIGVCYSNGIGLRKNMPTAYRYFSRASELGHVEAQFKVGWCLLYGKGVHSNPETAKKWLKLAAFHGHTEAAKLLSVKS